MVTKDLYSANTIIIGIDHGFGLIKTANNVFSAGIKEITTEPARYDDVLEKKRMIL